jgi:hypothetical protein
MCVCVLNIYFLIIFLVCAALHNFFLFFFIQYVYVDFYYKLILIKKFIEHNQVNE